MNRLRVLITAYACEPALGSEAGIGWNSVEQVSRFHEAWVITRANNRPRIDSFLDGRPLPGVHWVFLDLPRWAMFWKRGPKGARPYYYLWQIAAYRAARRLHAEVGFDLAHHSTFGTYWMPTFLARLNVPFIWGPVGGGESGPRFLYRTMSLRGRLLEIGRDFVRAVAEHDPAVRAAARHADVALATTEETAVRLRRLGSRRVELLSHVALSTPELERLSRLPRRSGEPFRLVSIGRLLHWKGIHLGIEAFAHLRREIPDAEYWIIGEGPERRRLERLARRLNLDGAVRFLGSVRREEVFDVLDHCEVLVHPSFHDSGGYVLAEAMAAARPVICLDLGGPGIIVSPESGVKVPARAPDQIVADLAAAMVSLARNPELRRRLGTEPDAGPARCCAGTARARCWTSCTDPLGPGRLASTTPRPPCDLQLEGWSADAATELPGGSQSPWPRGHRGAALCPRSSLVPGASLRLPDTGPAAPRGSVCGPDRVWRSHPDQE
jgi:glycosyltransferase involved in cell wall biosynthesis